jgi:CDP-paratose synthetase
MRIALTGATGFIGTHLVPALVARKHEVAVLARAASDTGVFAPLGDHCRVYTADTYDDLQKCFSAFRPDAVIHLATLYLNQHTPADLPALINSNILFGTQVLEAMRETGTRNFLYFATRWQHLDDEAYKPANLYAATKQAFMDIVT